MISYSTDFSLEIVFSHIRGNPQIWPEYSFNFSCSILHTMGEFTYFGREICFDPKTFRTFAEELSEIRQGKGNSAKFHEVGCMIEFSISVLDRKTRASIRVREFQAGEEETATRQTAARVGRRALVAGGLHGPAQDPRSRALRVGADVGRAGGRRASHPCRQPRRSAFSENWRVAPPSWHAARTGLI